MIPSKNDKRKRLCSISIAWLLICQCFAITAYAEKPDWPSDTGVVAEAGIVIDADTGTVLFGQNIKVPYPPASITKLLTALVVIESGSFHPDDVVTFSEDAINNVEDGSGNVLNLSPGDQMTVRDCLYGLLLKSSNQCANALAEHVAGTRDAFVDLMNEKIKALGCTRSHFANPSGLNSSEQYVTAYDMALISRAAFNNPTLLEIDSTRTYKLPRTANHEEGMTIKMSHRILVTDDTSSPYYCEGAKGGKTGYTSLAGNTLVTYAERDGRRLISVILKGKQPQYYIDGKTLLDFGFARFQNVAIEGSETSFTTSGAPVTIGSQAYQPSELTLDAASGSGSISLPKDASFSDAEKALVEDMPSGHPEHAVAMVQYTYHDRKIGYAYLLLTDEAYAARAAAGASSAETGPGSQESPQGNLQSQDISDTSATEPPGTQTGSRPRPTNSSGAILRSEGWPRPTSSSGAILRSALAGLTVLALLTASSGIFLYYRKQQEERERAIRRERRRQRLMEQNISEEEFHLMLEQRMLERRGKRK